MVEVGLGVYICDRKFNVVEVECFIDMMSGYVLWYDGDEIGDFFMRMNFEDLES